MPKFSETYSKWRSLGEGALAIILGLLLICFGQIVPRLGYQLLMGYFFLVSSLAFIDTMVSGKVP